MLMTKVVQEDVARPTAVPPDIIQRIVDELQPVQIWLYGSRARGTAREDSDWDIFVVLRDDAPEDDLDGVKRWPRTSDLAARGVELVATTKSEFEEWRDALGTLSQIVFDEGILVYGQ